MLRIRPEQMEVLTAYSLKAYVMRAASELGARYPDKTAQMSPEELEELIRSGVDKAEQYQIEEEDDVTEFIEFMLVYGRDFDSDPKLARLTQILADPSLDGSDKMEKVGMEEAVPLMDHENA